MRIITGERACQAIQDAVRVQRFRPFFKESEESGLLEGCKLKFLGTFTNLSFSFFSRWFVRGGFKFMCFDHQFFSFPQQFNMCNKKRRIWRWFRIRWKSLGKTYREKVFFGFAYCTDLKYDKHAEKSVHFYINNFFVGVFLQLFHRIWNQPQIFPFLIPILTFSEKNFLAGVMLEHFANFEAKRTGNAIENDFFYVN